MKTLRGLLDGIAVVDDEQDRDIHGVSLDSRSVVPGGVFLACAGISSHGLGYADQAVRQGAVAVLWESSAGAVPPRLPPDVVVIEVPRLSEFSGAIAAAFYGDPSTRMNVIGVTGTNGKTSVTHLLAQALNTYGQRCAVIGTLGYGFVDSLEPPTHTTPDAVKLQSLFAQLLGSGADAVAMEVSSHALQQHRVGGVVFRTAVFTNLTRDHLDYHGDIDSYAAAKQRLFSMPGLQNAVINADDAVGRRILAALPESILRVAFATHDETVRDLRADIVVLARKITYETHGLALVLDVNGDEFLLRASLFGRFNALNILAVFGVLLATGLSNEEALRVAASIRPVRGRMERLGGGDRPLVIVDYAHTPDALAQILSAAREHCAGSLTCVFGCGGDRDRGKRPEMGRIAASLADRVVVTDDNPRTENADAIVAEILTGVDSGNVRVERDRARAIREAVASAVAGDVVVIAGKGHEDYQIVGTRREYFSDSDVARSALESAA